MTGAVMLITDVVFGATATVAVTTALVFCMFVALWYLLPLRRRITSENSK